MLRRHSNPTKNKVWWPRQTRLLVGFGLRFFLQIFIGFHEFLQVFDCFSTQGLMAGILGMVPLNSSPT
jgi:hypothetical protein